MCGRFSLVEAFADLQTHFHFIMRDDFHYTPSQNITPSQDVMAIVEVNELRYPVSFKWGLIPSFAQDAKIGYKTFNARAETVHQKPSFRNAFQSKRCIIPATAFYEWHKKTPKIKQPYRIHPAEHSVFAFAGLWESWRNGDNLIRSCTIITTTPNDKMSAVHDRMPVILQPDDYTAWLSARSSKEALQALLTPLPSSQLQMEPVSPTFFT
ncbi:SOS response-associated peptidase [Jeotgalibacillus soli]|uniref:Abasic site processing protein n=1 Tax=Jeotgalibacillus soli TaxID=889306 RepID=A0A0C2VV00_9BACL|nr:SOS response-associated peptidase [Jeotgalibacillus soli]KIL48256.1 hypothetical protein KP78_17030 [Jeotgalibacillus soli]